MTNMMEPNPTSQVSELRASDADRDAVAQLLGEAHADGRLTQEEHAERLEAVLRAKTIGELAPLTGDLPSGPVTGSHPNLAAPAGLVGGAADRELLATGVGDENITAVFGAAERKGRWLVEPRTNVSTICGGVELDMREAVLAQQEVVVQCAVVLGGLEIIVPPGLRVVNDTSAVLGGVDTGKHQPTSDPNAPTLRLTGLCLMAGVSVRTLAAGAEK